MNVQHAQWLGHMFSVYDFSEAASIQFGGVYIFAAFENALNSWLPVYVGQTSKLATRLPNHEKWSAAQRLRATHVHVCFMALENQRRSLENYLIDTYHPPLNDLGR